MKLIESGKISFFNGIKKFGFIQASNGEKIFFNMVGKQGFSLGQFGVVFSDQSCGRIPKVGDDVKFVRIFGYEDPRAYPWGFTDEYNEVAERWNKYKNEQRRPFHRPEIRR